MRLSYYKLRSKLMCPHLVLRITSPTNVGITIVLLVLGQKMNRLAKAVLHVDCYSHDILMWMTFAIRSPMINRLPQSVLACPAIDPMTELPVSQKQHITNYIKRKSSQNYLSVMSVSAASTSERLATLCLRTLQTRWLIGVARTIVNRALR